MKLKPQIEEFIEIYMKALKDNSAAVFVGAGLSKSSGFVDWKSLLRPIARDLKLDIDLETDLIALTQFYINEHNGRYRINQLILEEFAKKTKINENHQILARLPITTYWTTNYDTLIEDALKSADKTPDVKMVAENLAVNLPKRDVVIYKMHGDVSQPHNAVITKDDYEKFDRTRHLFSTALEGDLVQKTFLFIGFSFSDPNIGYILGRIRHLLGENQREHYCLMQRIQRKNFKKQREYLYAKTKQELQIKDLKRYCIRAVLLDDYADIARILRRIENKYKLKHVFISGSAANYGKYNEKSAQLFLHNLSKNLCRNNFSIITGFGLGVGSAVINGALEHVFSTKYQHIGEYLTLRPFPQFVTGKQKLPVLRQQYREEIIGKAGIAIYVFGNKLNEKGEVIDADGLWKEFKIAIDKGVRVIPIGKTGFVARKIWQQVWKARNKYLGANKKIHSLFKKLNSPKIKLTQTISIVVQIIKEYSEE